LNDTFGDFSFLMDVGSESLSDRKSGIFEDLMLAPSDSCITSLVAILRTEILRAFGSNIGIGVSFITDFESLLVSFSGGCAGSVVCGSFDGVAFGKEA
jgi:hypothetical protein